MYFQIRCEFEKKRYNVFLFSEQLHSILTCVENLILLE